MAVEASKRQPKKVSQEWPLIKRKAKAKKQPVRKLVRGHIQKHTKPDGYVFYTYRRGTDKEIYLGDADVILKAVKGAK